MSAKATKDGVEVKAGQVWRSLDQSSEIRTHTITSVDRGVAWYSETRGIAIYKMHKHATGWELVTT